MSYDSNMSLGGCYRSRRAMARRKTFPVRRMLKSAAAVAVAATATLAAGCHSAPLYDYKSEPDPRTTEFKIGPLDHLSVVVWKNKDLSADVIVRPDGVITLPLLGDVKAAGRTPSEVQKEVTQRFGEFVRNEQVVVSIAIAQVNSYYFTVSGNVEHSGLYTSKSYVSTVEAVAMAGGPNKYAGDSIYIVRGQPARRIPIDLSSATSGEHPEQNLMVVRGDVIVVP
jgi:polysaccharide biosynthesis/export protein